MNNSLLISAIDVGTNSFHMVTASLDSLGQLKVISRDKEVVRLGSGIGDMKFLDKDAMSRGVDTLHAFAEIARSHGATIRAVATSAVREAENKNEFVEMVRQRCGIEIEVVTGLEEARLIFIGAMHSLPIYKKKSLLIDIGGGSTETVIGKEGEIFHSNSVKLGAIRLTRQFFPDGNATEESIEACTKFIKGNWEPTLDRIVEIGYDISIGTSGTIQNIAQIALALNKKNIPDTLNGTVISKKDFLRAIDEIKAKKTAQERAQLPAIDSKREDIILAGALIIERAVKELEIEEITLSGYALREGIVFDTFQKLEAINEYHHLSTLRFDTIKHLCKNYDVDVEHAEHVKSLCLDIYDGTAPIHGLGWKERELLTAAAYLHDVGFHISHDGHHKHSFYIIKNCAMPGFTSNEQELIALVARYHRKSHPKSKHQGYSSLNQSQKYLVWVLGSVLRIAEGLDRRQKSLIKKVQVQLNEKNIHLKTIPNTPEVNPDIEIWGAKRRLAMMAEVLKINVTLE